MMWVQDARRIAYQKNLTPTQKLILELVHYNTFSLTELASILGMRKRDLNRRVLGALEGYLDTGTEGFVIPKKGIENVLENNFDKERFEAVQSEIKKERDKYRDKILLGPLRRLLEKAEADKLDRSIEVTS